jgi:hypothetical protein
MRSRNSFIAALLVAIPSMGVAQAKDCPSCGQAQTQALVARTNPASQGIPSQQFIATLQAQPTLQAGGIPECAGGTGPCWFSGNHGPCFPEIPPQLIYPQAAPPVSAQAQMLAPHAPCLPCECSPSLYCPPMLFPAKPAIPLRAAGVVPIVRPIYMPPCGPSGQFDEVPSSQAY